MYSEEFLEKLDDDCQEAVVQLNMNLVKLMVAAQSIAEPLVKQYLNHGAGRRLKLLRCCLVNVFDLLPPDTTKPVASSVTDDVQINLHAFVMNLSGLFDNLAWAFVLRHNLLKAIGDRSSIGLFKKRTQERLPLPLSDYLTSPTMIEWHNHYLKAYRDSLAHRIPLYVPPAMFSHDQGSHYSELESEKWRALSDARVERVEEISDEQAKMGSACLLFLTALSDDLDTRPNYIHPQMLCDVATVNEFVPIFLEHWHTAKAD